MRIEMHQSQRRVTDQSARRTRSRAAVRKAQILAAGIFEHFSATVESGGRNGSYEADSSRVNRHSETFTDADIYIYSFQSSRLHV